MSLLSYCIKSSPTCHQELFTVPSYFILAIPHTDSGSFDTNAVVQCFAELQHKAVLFRENGMIASLDLDAAVVKSDIIIHSELKKALKVASAPLENLLDKDWHPGSDEKVVDLVHPSLFPLVYGRSRALPSGRVCLKGCEDFIGKGELVAKADESEHLINEQFRWEGLWDDRKRNNYWSRDFQWLPCEVAFLENNEIEITSYINNLRPAQHPHLYSVIEKIISKSVPLWNEVLSSVKARRSPRIEMESTEYEWPQGKEVPENHTVPEDEREESDGEEIDEYERQEHWEKSSRVLVMPEPGEFKPFEYSDKDKVDLKSQYAEQGLQIIVKLANIELTQDKPEYEGGSWHVEGQMNEHICASALYYYDSDNITDSFLAFRHRIDNQALEEKAFDQGDYEAVEQIYGIEQDGPAIQELGRVLTKEGRLLAFPNAFQHRVSSFRLADPTKPGYRKILALFLVDPNIRILSTANVPPQQKSWLSQEVLGRTEVLVEKTSRLPNELVDKIVPHISHSTITLDEAKKIRLKLMEERKASVEDLAKKMNSTTFSFCEH